MRIAGDMDRRHLQLAVGISLDAGSTGSGTLQ
jgi:hypothetical protein